MDTKTPTRIDAPAKTSRTLAKVFVGASVVLAIALIGGFFWIMFAPVK